MGIQASLFCIVEGFVKITFYKVEILSQLRATHKLYGQKGKPFKIACFESSFNDKFAYLDDLLGECITTLPAGRQTTPASRE